jgi:transposase-like protein
MTDTRKHLTAEQKIAILRRHSLEQVAVSDLCDEYGIPSSVFYRWQQQLFENDAAVFGRQSKGANDLDKALEEKLVRKNKVLSELMEEYVKVKRQQGWRQSLEMPRAELGRAGRPRCRG